MNLTIAQRVTIYTMLAISFLLPAFLAVTTLQATSRDFIASGILRTPPLTLIELIELCISCMLVGLAIFFTCGWDHFNPKAPQPVPVIVRTGRRP